MENILIAMITEQTIKVQERVYITLNHDKTGFNVLYKGNVIGEVASNISMHNPSIALPEKVAQYLAHETMPLGAEILRFEELMTDEADVLWHVILKSKVFGENHVVKLTPITPPRTQNISTSVTGVKFVITGTLSRLRADVEQLISDEGGFVNNKVTFTTDYLVVGKKGKGTKKYKDASRLGTQMIDEDDLYKMLGI